jgi:hypothetical protein
VNYGNTERVDHKVDNTQEQLRSVVEQMNIMYKRMLRMDERLTALEGKS